MNLHVILSNFEKSQKNQECKYRAESWYEDTWEYAQYIFKKNSAS